MKYPPPRILFYKPEVHEKKWGRELWIRNTGSYCGKILQFKPAAKFSLHFHVEKEETWYISKGRFILTYIETDRAKTRLKYLVVGDVVHLLPGQPHQLTCTSGEGGEVFEVSTAHYDEDSYRIAPGDSQT